MNADVLIVGGGIGGAVLAELLGRAGKKVVVLEKSTARPPWTRPEILWPATVELLFKLRPRAEWEREAMLPLQGVRAFNGCEFVPIIERRHFDAAVVQPWSTDPNLTRELLLRTSAFEVRRGVDVTEVLKDGGCVAGVRARTIAGGESFDVLAKWTVGDDGKDSIVRRACSVEMPIRPFPIDALCFKFDWPAAFLPGWIHAFPNFGGARAGILAMGSAPVPGGKGAGVVAVFGREFDAAASGEGTAALRSLHPVFDELAAGRRFPEDFARLKIRWGHAASYGAPGAVWMGDAAHAVSPAGGQGANMSVADARVLAELLARDGAAVVGEYERRRRPANERSIRPTRGAGVALGLLAWSRPAALFRLVAPVLNRDFVKLRALRLLASSFAERA